MGAMTTPSRLIVLALAAALMVPVAGSAGVRRKAPPIVGSRWINTRPLSAQDLAGRVVIVEFWTFGCVNCQRTVPAMRALQERVAGPDVVIVGVHTPELVFERDPRAVEKAVRDQRLAFPVVIDDDGYVWRGFGNRYWPALYVVDRRGVIRHTHIGELHQGTQAWDTMLAVVETLRREKA
jgi:thiol-disulfide isomerase/thioredoxin